MDEITQGEKDMKQVLQVAFFVLSQNTELT
jgi:hypothetical protein